MNFPLPGTSSRPQSLQQYQHHHHNSRSRQSFQIPSRQLNPNNSFPPLNITRNNPQFPNDFNFPLRSTRISSARSPSSPSRKVSRFAAIKEEVNPEIMNQAMHRQQISQESSGGMPQYRIFKRGETIPGFSSPLSLIPQGTSSQPHVDLSNIIRSSSSSEQENQAPGVKEESEVPTNENGGSTGGKRGPGNRTPISLVSDIARFHNVQAEYRLTLETGPPHAPTFTVILNLGEEQYQAQGPSIKKAQLAAATIAMEKTSLKSPPPRNQPKKQYQSANNNNNKNPKRANWTIMRLNALADELGEQISFTSQPVQILNPFNRADPPAIVAVNIGERVFTAEGPNVTAAKNSAALAALKVLTQQKKEHELAKSLENEVSLLAEAEELDSDIKSPISIVHEMALKRGLKVTFEIVSEEGPPHMKVFTINCKVGALETEGQGPTKQQAKKASCEAMITKLKEIPLKQPNLASLKSLQNSLKAKPKAARKKPSTPVIKEVKTQVVSPISRLLQIAHVRKYKEPEFRVVGQSDGTDATAAAAAEKSQDRRSKRKKPFFTMEVLVGPYICQGSGSNKKSAKKAAADAALVQMGYAPTEVIKEDAENSEKDPPDEEDESPKKCADLKITGARQIVPGVLVLHSENSGGSSTVGAQEIAKVNSMPTTATAEATPTKVLDGIGKLAYLAELLGISVSYSDFPKKNEFLSVASLGTNPPHVAHGIGPTREEAQNSAAVQILEELSTTGLDNLTSSTPRSS